MSRLPDWLLLFLFCQRSTLHIPLPITTVQQILNRSIDTRLTVKPASKWQSGYYYTLGRRNDQLYIKGPLGYRGRGRWCVVAQGILQPSPEGATLHLRVRLAASHLAMALLGLGFYVVGCFWIYGQVIQMMIVPVIFQWVFIYGILLAIFHYEVSQLIRRLRLMFVE